MQNTILITGATGAIGRALVPRMLNQSDADLVLLLHRTGVGPDSSRTVRRVLGLTSRDMRRVRPVVGDVTHPDLGLSAGDDAALTDRVTHVLHAAANTRFDLSLAEARLVNVDGTAHVIALAQRCSHLEQLGIVSSVYVSGRRTGRVFESELAHVAGFVNSYEQSKYEAEMVVRQSWDVCPTATYRVSTVLGDGHTGEVHSFTAPHHALRMMYLGLATVVPGTPDYRVDLVASNVAADAICELFLKHFRPMHVVHIASHPDHALKLRELIDETYSEFAEFDPAWVRRGYPKPAIATGETFELLLRSIESANNTVLQDVMGVVKHFALQLTMPKTFDRKHLLQAIPDYDTRSPHVREFFPKVVRYCLEHNWRRPGGQSHAA